MPGTAGRYAHTAGSYKALRLAPRRSYALVKGGDVVRAGSETTEPENCPHRSHHFFGSCQSWGGLSSAAFVAGRAGGRMWRSGIALRQRAQEPLGLCAAGGAGYRSGLGQLSGAVVCADFSPARRNHPKIKVTHFEILGDWTLRVDQGAVAASALLSGRTFVSVIFPSSPSQIRVSSDPFSKRTE